MEISMGNVNIFMFMFISIEPLGSKIYSQRWKFVVKYNSHIQV